MTRIPSLRRLAATAVVVGVTGSGALALAAPAMAAPGGAHATAAAAGQTVGTVVLPTVDPMTVGDLMGSLTKADGMAAQSPLPTGPVVIDIGHQDRTFAPQDAQAAQTVIVNHYGALGYVMGYSADGLLVIGDKICDPTQSATWNTGCVDPGADRF